MSALGFFRCDAFGHLHAGRRCLDDWVDFSGPACVQFRCPRFALAESQSTGIPVDAVGFRYVSPSCSVRIFGVSVVLREELLYWPW